MTTSDINSYYVALHHRTNRGDNARHIESVGAWLQQNVNSLVDNSSDDWIAVGIAPTSERAGEILDRLQSDLER